MITYRWRGPLSDAEMVDLVHSHGGRAVPGWWDQIRPFSLGWVTAREAPSTDRSGLVVGFVNAAWDGGDHAFLLDTKVRSTHQRLGIGLELVHVAEQHARSAGCEWLHVDWEPPLGAFYLDACGFRSTEAGLIRLDTSG